MTSATFEAFESATLAEGFDEVLERSWPPSTVVDTHRHPFSLKALLVSGEMWLNVGQESLHLTVGDTFMLDADVPHSERYGAEGATYWVARRNGSMP